MKNTITPMSDQLNAICPEEVSRVGGREGRAPTARLGGQDGGAEGVAGTGGSHRQRQTPMASEPSKEQGFGKPLPDVATAIARGGLKPQDHVDVKGEDCSFQKRTVNTRVEAIASYLGRSTAVGS